MQHFNTAGNAFINLKTRLQRKKCIDILFCTFSQKNCLNSMLFKLKFICLDRKNKILPKNNL